MNFPFDTESDFGVNYGGFGDRDYSKAFEFDPTPINQYSYNRENTSESGNSFDRILEALGKASAFKSMSSGTGSTAGATTGGGNTGTFQKISDVASVYIPPPKQKITGGTSGGLGSAIGGIAGTALGLIPGVGPIAAGLLPKVGSTVGGLFG